MRAARSRRARGAARSMACALCARLLFSASQVIVQNGCVTDAGPFMSMTVATLHPAPGLLLAVVDRGALIALDVDQPLGRPHGLAQGLEVAPFSSSPPEQSVETTEAQGLGAADLHALAEALRLEVHADVVVAVELGAGVDAGLVGLVGEHIDRREHGVARAR